MSKWIAAGYDSAPGYALGDTPEAAQAAYIEKFGEPRHGFSVIRSRSDYDFELKRVAASMGYAARGSIPLINADEWIVVARLSDDAVDALDGKEVPRGLLHDWSRDDGEYFIVARAPRPQPESRQDRITRIASLDEFEGMEPSQRQREWAQNRPWDWADNIAFAHKRGDLELTQEEIEYTRARYRAIGATPTVVNSIYRW